MKNQYFPPRIEITIGFAGVQPLMLSGDEVVDQNGNVLPNSPTYAEGDPKPGEEFAKPNKSWDNTPDFGK